MERIEDPSHHSGDVRPPMENGSPRQISERVGVLANRVGALKERYRMIEWELRALGEDAPADGEGSAGRDDLDRDSRLLIATSLAVTGTSRAQADEYLRETFGTDDNERILGEVFGSIEAAPDPPPRRRWRRDH